MSLEMQIMKEIVAIAKEAGNLGPWLILFGGGLLIYFKVLKTGKIVVVANGNGKGKGNCTGKAKEGDQEVTQLALCEMRFGQIEGRLKEGDSTLKEYGKKINQTHSIAVRLLERSRNWEQTTGGGKMKRLMFLGISLVVLAMVLVGCASYKCNYVTVNVPLPEGADKPAAAGKVEVTTAISPYNPIEVSPLRSIPINANAGDSALDLAKKSTPQGAAAGVAEAVIDEATKK